MKKLSFVFTIFLLIFLTACEMEVEDIKRTCTLQDIKVDASKAKLEYLKSQAFNSDGVKIYGYYSDNTIKEIDPRYVDFDGFPKTDDEKIIDVDIPITVFYEGFKDTYNIKFQDDCIVGIIVDIQKRNYLLHEAFSADDIIVSAKYESGNFDVIDFPNYTISGFYTEMANITGKEVTITYKDLEPVKYDILVFPNTVSNLIIFSNPTKTIYTHNESLDLTGLVVEAKYGVSAYVEVKPEHYTYKIFSADDINFENSFRNPDIKELDPGDYKIVIYLDDVQTEPINIKILNAYQTGMCLDPDSTPKLIYNVYEPFDINQYVFRETLSDGSIGKVIDKESTGFYLEGGDPVLSEANKKVTIKARSSFFNYEKGEKDEAKCDFDIFVTDAYIIEVVAEWKNNPEEKDYLPLGAKPSDEKYGTWTVMATFSDSREVKIPNEYCNFEFADENIRNGKYDDFYSRLAASEDSTVKYEVNISFYKEKEDDLHSCTGTILVGKPKIINAEITKYPTTKYTVGQTFDPQGLTIKVTTSDGNTEIYEYGEETSEYFTISSDDFTKPKSEEVKILFKKDDFIYKPSIWVNVYENKPIALRISPNQRIINLRKGNSYTNEQYQLLFEIHKVYESGYEPELTLSEYEKVIVYFEQTNKKYKTDEKWYGSVYAIFNDGQNSILGKYECFEENVDGASNTPVIFIIPPLPQKITMDNKKDNNKIAFDSNDFAESLTWDTTKYNIVYKDGQTYEISGNEFKTAAVNYNSINYQLVKSQNMVKIHYETVQSAAFEPAVTRGDYVVADYTSLQNLDTIKSLKVIRNPDFTKENPDNKYYFIRSKIESKNNSYNLNNYFKASVTYFTGVEQEVTGDKLNYLHFSLNDKENGFKVKYEDGASKAEAEINGIKILEPITINDNDRDNLLKSKDLYTNVKFSFKDELGISHDNFKIENSELPDQTNFNTNKPIKVSLSKNDDNQKYYLTIPGSIKDIDGQVGNYEIELFEDFVTGLVCENGNNNIVQTYLAENGDIKNKLSSSPIKIRKFFDTNLESISAQTDGNFTFSEVNANSQTQINITYKNESEILPLLGGYKTVTINWTINESLEYHITVNLYPAYPTKGETCLYDFENNNNQRKGIKFTYENGFNKYERFYTLYTNNNVIFLDSEEKKINTNFEEPKYSNAFNSDCIRMKVNINGREYSIPISRPNQGNNNQNQQQGN